MSFQSRLAELITAIGADFKADRTTMGALSSLTTTAKSSLVAAINEINAKPSGGGADPWSYQIMGSAGYSNTTVTASDVFTGFVPAANARYIVDILASVSTAAATTGIQTALVGPTTGITRSAVKIVSASAAATDKIDHLALNAFQAAAAGLTTPSLLMIQAIIEVGATPGAGNIKLQARSEVAASAVNIHPGSSMRWRTI